LRLPKAREQTILAQVQLRVAALLPQSYPAFGTHPM
jgi:hypothetical protein